MKYIKNFENKQKLPKKGNYILMYTNTPIKELADFINNTIGVVHVNSDVNTSNWVKYENVPENIKRFFITPVYGNYGIFIFQGADEIIAYSKNKNDIETIINAEKYNL